MWFRTGLYWQWHLQKSSAWGFKKLCSPVTNIKVSISIFYIQSIVGNHLLKAWTQSWGSRLWCPVSLLVSIFHWHLIVGWYFNIFWYRICACDLWKTAPSYPKDFWAQIFKINQTSAIEKYTQLLLFCIFIKLLHNYVITLCIWIFVCCIYSFLIIDIDSLFFNKENSLYACNPYLQQCCQLYISISTIFSRFTHFL